MVCKQKQSSTSRGEHVVGLTEAGAGEGAAIAVALEEDRQAPNRVVFAACQGVTEEVNEGQKHAHANSYRSFGS